MIGDELFRSGRRLVVREADDGWLSVEITHVGDDGSTTVQLDPFDSWALLRGLASWMVGRPIPVGPRER